MSVCVCVEDYIALSYFITFLFYRSRKVTTQMGEKFEVRTAKCSIIINVGQMMMMFVSCQVAKNVTLLCQNKLQ